MRRRVRFDEAVRTLLGAGYRGFVEVSPHPVLTGAIAETAEDAAVGDVVVVGTLERERGDARQVLMALARAHVGGLPVDWTRVVRPGRAVELPTYAFQHQRYWLRSATTPTAMGTEGSPAEAAFWAAVEEGDLARLADTLAIDDQDQLGRIVPALASWRQRERHRSVTAGWRYRIDWAPIPEPTTTHLTGTWLIATPTGHDTGDITTALSIHGATTIVLAVPANTLGRNEMVALLDDHLNADGSQPAAISGVLSLLALDETPVPDHPVVPAGLATTLAFVQALGDVGVEAPLWTVTSGAIAATPGEELTNPAQAQVCGFGRVVGLEYPERWGGLIDLPAVIDDRAGARLCAVLAGCDENAVAIRPAGIFGRRFAHAPQLRDPARPWACRGTALITGGTGALGGHVARWLTGRGARRLVLTSRSGPVGQDVAAQAADLAALGSRVDVVACDVSDRSDVAGVLEWTGPELSTVVHTAAVLDDGVIDRLSTDRLETVLAAKAGGATHLDELTAHVDLDAFVLFSSVVATTGGPGQSNYAAANAYLDAVAANRRSRGLTGLSVAWGPWAAGVAQGSEAARQRLARNDWEGVMEPELAVRALGEALDADESVLTVTNIDWSVILATPQSAAGLLEVPLMRNLPEVHRLAALLARAPAVTDEGDLARRLSAMTPAEQRRTLTELVQAKAAQVLGYPSFDAADGERAFSELGFDSLTAVELRNEVNTATGLRLPATLLFDYPSAAALAEHLRTELLGALPEATPVAGTGSVVDEPIAIVGMSCRYPGGVVEPGGLWQLLASGGDAISGFPDDRGWDLAALTDPSGEAGTSYVQQGGFIDDITGFDAAFFGISPREALAMDPQQRLLLELSWEALEHSGIDPKTLRGSATGVFAGGYTSGYAHGVDVEGAAHLITGNATSVLSGRVSYALGLEGPAVTVDTACSSSLVAIHLAAQALRSGECSMALAGGITVLVTPDGFVGFSEQNGLAADGRCKAFSAAADGMGFAEGAGIVVVERLSDAQRNGHKVLAVLRGSATNQDGASNGLTAPNGPSQQRVIRAALANAGLNAEEIDVVEAHGTGTELGDPIEAQALLATYGKQRPANRPLLLGSVKSNIGHTQAAAGVAGVIKMVLALQHSEVPRTLHVDEPSPHVDWAAGDVRLVTESVPWPVGERPRRAGVSSFGLSGTNAHLILEEAPPSDIGPSDEEIPPSPLVESGGVATWLLSAQSAEALAAQADRLSSWVAARSYLGPADVAWSLAATRSVFEYRGVVVGADRDELVDGVAALGGGVPSGSVVSGVARSGVRVVFVFAGQGSQWVGMGRELAQCCPVFAARLAECAAALAPFVEWSLLDVLSDEDAAALEAADVVQPVLWAVMVSLAAVWEAAGVRPDAVVGHSQGEIAAATVAGMLSLEDGARVVALRSRALTALAGAGGMLSVAESAARVRERLARWGGRVSLAAVNGPAAVIVSGEPQALEELRAELEVEGVRARLVAVDYASHSPQVEQLEAEILSALSGIAPRVGRVSMVSAVTGEVLTGEELDAEYWYASLRAPVEFDRAVRVLAAEGHEVFIEITPHPVLLGPTTDTLDEVARNTDAEPAVVCGTLRRDDGGATRLLTSLGEAFVQGVPVDWTAVLPRGERVELPTYAFQHDRYWPRGASAASAGDAVSLGLGAVSHPLLGAAVDLAGGTGVVCTGRLSLRTHPWLADHAVGGVILLPGTGFVELAIRAGDHVGCGLLEELTLQSPLVLPTDGGVQVQVVVSDADADGRRRIEVFSRPDTSNEGWTQHAGGTLAPSSTQVHADDDLVVWPPRDATELDIAGMYDGLAGAYGYGPAFRGLHRVWRRGEDLYAEVVLPESVAEDAGRFGLHPALLDSVLHAGSLLPDITRESGEVRLPFAWSDVTLHASGASALRARLRRDDDGNLGLHATDTTGAPVITVDALATRPVSPDQLRPAVTGIADALYTVGWAPVPTGAAPTGEWAMIGADPFHVAEALSMAGVSARGFAELTDLAAAAEAGEIAPKVVLACLGGDYDRDVAHAAQRATGEALALVKAWLDEDHLDPATLVILTRGGMACSPGERVTDLAAAAVWGLLRSAQSENPDRLVLVDLPEHGIDDKAAATLASVVDSGEPELALRGTAAFGRRLVRPSGALVAPEGLWRLEPDAEGSLDGLALAATSHADEPLDSGQIKVAVRAGGLNFRDVLIALGMYPGGGVMGSEIAGTVIETAPDVSGLAVGDRVMGVAEGGFAPVAVTEARQVVPIPDGWSYAEAAAVPSAFLTAWYALVELAGAQTGRKVLVHAAAGGVGMAAVQIARHLGLEVFATASPAKWPVLTAMGIDRAHLSSSRSTGFAAEFLAATDGAGVDIVLNSLAGELTDASLRLLPTGGSFIELGRTDLRDAEALRAEYPAVAYRPVDLAEAGPQRLGEMLSEIAELMADETLERLPVRTWDVRRAPEAFRFMSQARHTGKLVLTIPVPQRPGQRAALVTGGTGTLGGLVAKHLVTTGRADEVVLTGRSGPSAATAAAVAAELAASGARVQVMACDAADREAIGSVIDRVTQATSLKTVVHTAGVLDDGTIASLTPERVSTVLRPKVDGAWHLHQLTKDSDLEEFVLFSSAASTLGAAGQGNYVAANAFLDALAADRRAAGLPATSLAWGLWAETSALTGQLTEAERARINRGGVSALSADDGLALFDLALDCDEALLVPAHFDLAGLRARAARSAQVPPIWRELIRGGVARRGAAAAQVGADSLHHRLTGLSEQDRERALTDLVRTHVAAVLGHARAEVIEATRAFTDLGFDSLTAVELRNRLGTATGLRLPATLVFDYPNPRELAAFLQEKLVPYLDDRGETDSAEEKLRQALATVPLSRFREAGVMDVLMRLAGVHDEAPTENADEQDIDALDAESLIRLAMDRETE
ncbi:type I polyketide synthase [Nocardia transvalensis]|uniref:type I polyketide synthase n=1 Tax=Nocardia transvalensis TaxID=37333 RepID=UPI00226BBE01|nr:type I polyketide synthase [Nocardia transvalensis]